MTDKWTGRHTDIISYLRLDPFCEKGQVKRTINSKRIKKRLIKHLGERLGFPDINNHCILFCPIFTNFKFCNFVPGEGAKERLTEPPGRRVGSLLRRSTRLRSILGSNSKTLPSLAKEQVLLASYWPRRKFRKCDWSRLWLGFTVWPKPRHYIKAQF